MSTPQPGVYRKGHLTRVADTASEAVALSFEGFVKQTAETVAADSSYRDLQEQAKALGIPANQSTSALVDAITSHVPADGEVPTGGDRPTPELSYVSGLSGDAEGDQPSDS